MSFQFSQDQHNAINGICTALLDSDPSSHSLAVLTGSAGTGKTTVVAEILEKIVHKAPMTNIKLCASTHRASVVLQDIVGQSVSTVHSLFKLRPGVGKQGKPTLKSSGLCEIPHGSIIIIDESSMIGNQFLTEIVPIIKKRALNVLFVGDPFQLPPPDDVCSIFDGSLPTFTLTKVHRQAGGNPILETAVEYRKFIDGIRHTAPEIITSINAIGEGIHVLPHSDFVTKFVQKYVNYNAGDEVDIPLCTYTNESAINYNSMIRKAAYFLEDTIQPFYEGERLIANSVVMMGDQIVLTNNEVVYVKAYVEGVFNKIPGYYVTVNGDYNKFTKSNLKKVFSPKTKTAKNKVLNEHKAKAVKSNSKKDWIDFYALKNSLADLRPPFAGTTHKAQGGTFPAIFIDRTNINKCHDEFTKARLMYVALTRASKNVYING